MLSQSHPFFPAFQRLMAEAAAAPPTYDLGTSCRFAKEVGLVRDLFNNDEYVAGGFNPDLQLPNDACDFHCDVENLSEITDGSVGSVLCISVLEHVIRPRAAAREIARILRPGGLAIVSVPFFASYHAKLKKTSNPVYESSTPWSNDSRHEGYSDFWRFTHEGLAMIFAEAGFSRVDVFPIDGWLIARLEILRMYKAITRIPVLKTLVNRLDRPRLGSVTTMHFMRGVK